MNVLVGDGSFNHRREDEALGHVRGGGWQLDGWLALALALGVVIGAIDLLIAGAEARLGAMLVLAPLVACMRTGPRETALAVLAALVIVAALGLADGSFAHVDQLTRVIAVALGGGVAVVIARIRRDHEATEARLAAVLESALDCVISMDHRGRVLEFNPAAEATFGYARADVLGRELAELILPDRLREGHRAELARYRATRESRMLGTRLETSAIRADGRELTVELAMTRTGDAGGRPVFTAFLRDITERRQTEERLAHLALHDPLTDLPNRRLLVDHLALSCERGRRSGAPTTLLYLDLDGFKPINDRFGHAAGDELLVALARRLEQAVRPADTVARLGGDEFAVLCEDLRGDDQAVAIALRVCGALEQPIELADGREVAVSASVGLATTRGTDDTPDSLIARADAAMYKAKQRSRGREDVLEVCPDPARGATDAGPQEAVVMTTP